MHHTSGLYHSSQQLPAERKTMDEVVSRQNAGSCKTQNNFIESLLAEKVVIEIIEEACRPDRSILPCSGTRSSLLALGKVMFDVASRIQRSDDFGRRTMAERKIFEALESERFRVFTRLIRSNLVARRDDLKFSAGKVLYVPNFGNVSISRALTLRDEELNDFVVF